MLTVGKGERVDGVVAADAKARRIKNTTRSKTAGADVKLLTPQSGRLRPFAKPSGKARYLRRGDVSIRRKATVADRGLGRLKWVFSLSVA